MRANAKGFFSVKGRGPTESPSDLAERLIERFGELMTYEQLGALLKRRPDSLQAVVTRQQSDFSSALWAARVKLGRRVYFRSAQVAAIVWQNAGNGDVAA